MQKTVLELHELLKNKELSVEELIRDCFSAIEKSENSGNFVSLNKEKVLAKAKDLDLLEADNLLYGLPIIIKDNIAVKDESLTAGSKILENYLSPFDAHVIKKLKENNMIIIGKAQMDEFALSNKNECIAEILANGQVTLALGAANLRLSAIKYNLIAMKATYGRVSRYGLAAATSSLDQIGPMTKTVYDNALLLAAISGRDDNDLTSSSKESEDFTRYIDSDINSLKIGIIKNKNTKSLLDKFKNIGIPFDEIELQFQKETDLAYKIISMAETSSNLARYDGVRYAYRAANLKTVDELYEKTRSEGFSRATKEEILLGSYILGGENADIYYNKAMMVRAEIKDIYDELFSKYDLIISFADESILKHSNLTGNPSLAMLMTDDVAIQIIANYFDEAKIYQLASYIENKVGDLNV